MLYVLLLGIATMTPAPVEPMVGAHYLSPQVCYDAWLERQPTTSPWPKWGVSAQSTGLMAEATCKSFLDCAASSYQYCAIKGSTVKMGIYVVQKANGDANCQVTCVSGDVGFLKCKDATKAPSKDDPVCPPGAGLCDPCQPIRPACCDDAGCES